MNIKYIKLLLASSCQSVSQSVCLSVHPSARPSVRPHGTTRLPLKEFLWNLMLEYLSKIFFEKIQASLKSVTKITSTLHEDDILSVLLKMRKFSDKHRREYKKKTFCSRTSFEKSCHLWDNVEKCSKAKLRRVHYIASQSDGGKCAAELQCNSNFKRVIMNFDVRKSVHHHYTIQINQPTRCNSFTSLLLDVYVWLKMFRAPLRPSSGAYKSTRRLWFYHWSVAVGAFLVVVWPDLDQQRSNSHAPTVKPKAPSAVVRSWWWA